MQTFVEDSDGGKWIMYIYEWFENYGQLVNRQAVA